mmetsp:Transcript_35682/g.83516  ORF Transcript_35682/g.83516 Transcript_35682/m.83516 type:complete len:274 (+) Transcript_35682:112-933(+)
MPFVTITGTSEWEPVKRADGPASFELTSSITTTVEAKTAHQHIQKKAYESQFTSKETEKVSVKGVVFKGMNLDASAESEAASTIKNANSSETTSSRSDSTSVIVKEEFKQKFEILPNEKRYIYKPVYSFMDGAITFAGPISWTSAYEDPFPLKTPTMRVEIADPLEEVLPLLEECYDSAEYESTGCYAYHLQGGNDDPNFRNRHQNNMKLLKECKQKLRSGSRDVGAALDACIWTCQHDSTTGAIYLQDNNLANRQRATKAKLLKCKDLLGLE